jgi:hypothetical protein
MQFLVSAGVVQRTETSRQPVQADVRHRLLLDMVLQVLAAELTKVSMHGVVL